MDSKAPQLDLFIYTIRVGLYPQPSANITNDELANETMTTGSPNHTSPTHLTCLLSGALDDFLIYSGQEQSQWLADISHDICDPAQKRGLLQVWDVAGELWRNVNPTDPLIASGYLYDVQATVSLTKISKREGKSKTSATGNPSTMASRVKQRDGERCWISRMYHPLVNSHVCPKRIEDRIFCKIYSTFVSTAVEPSEPFLVA
jgi:hypothetical protein